MTEFWVLYSKSCHQGFVSLVNPTDTRHPLGGQCIIASQIFLCAVCRSGRSEKTTCCLQSCGSCGVHSHVCWLYPDMGILDEKNDSSFLDNDTLADSALSWSSLAQHDKSCYSVPHLPHASGWCRRWEISINWWNFLSHLVETFTLTWSWDWVNCHSFPSSLCLLSYKSLWRWSKWYHNNAVYSRKTSDG